MTDVAHWIAGLSSADATRRAESSEDLFRAGKELGDAAVAGWMRVPDIAALMAGGPTVGIAVQPETFSAIRTAMGAPRLADVPADQDAQEFELHIGGARLDILTTKGTPGAIAKFLEKFGEGIQQVEYLVMDVDRATLLLQKKLGVTPIYPATRAGADGTRTNFFLAATPEGRKVLIELVELAR